jgi:hypothetical protein
VLPILFVSHYFPRDLEKREKALPSLERRHHSFEKNFKLESTFEVNPLLDFVISYGGCSLLEVEWCL